MKRATVTDVYRIKYLKYRFIAYFSSLLYTFNNRIWSLILIAKMSIRNTLMIGLTAVIIQETVDACINPNLS